MTLDEAIEYAEWCAEDGETCDECAEEHRQLAEWLRELKRLRTENDKLRELVRELHTQVHFRTVFGYATDLKYLIEEIEADKCS